MFILPSAMLSLPGLQPYSESPYAVPETHRLMARQQPSPAQLMVPLCCCGDILIVSCQKTGPHGVLGSAQALGGKVWGDDYPPMETLLSSMYWISIWWKASTALKCFKTTVSWRSMDFDSQNSDLVFITFDRWRYIYNVCMWYTYM